MTIVERMGQALAEAYGPDVEFGDQARAALRAVRPEDVSDGMLGVFVKVDGGHSLAFFTAEAKDTLRRAIAAAISKGAE